MAWKMRIYHNASLDCLRLWPLCLVSMGSACGLPRIIMDHLCILVIILLLSAVAKTFCCSDGGIAEIEMIDVKG